MSFLDTSIEDAAATSSSAGGTSTRSPVKGFSSVTAANPTASHPHDAPYSTLPHGGREKVLSSLALEL